MVNASGIHIFDAYDFVPSSLEQDAFFAATNLSDPKLRSAALCRPRFSQTPVLFVMLLLQVGHPKPDKKSLPFLLF
jgi:hypothetical protein